MATKTTKAAKKTAAPVKVKAIKVSKAAAEADDVPAPKKVKSAKGATIATSEGVVIAEQRHVDAAPTTPKGKVEVFITLRQRDEINESAPAAIKSLMANGTDVRVNNGKPRPDSIPAILPQYYARWRFRLELTEKQRDALAEYLSTDLATKVSEVKAPRRGPKSNVDPKEAAEIEAAKELVKSVDAMSAPEAVKAAGTDEFQHAIEVVAKASQSARRGSSARLDA